MTKPPDGPDDRADARDARLTRRRRATHRFDKIILRWRLDADAAWSATAIVAEFGVEPESYDPDEAVAKGAALYGLKESLQDEVRDILSPANPEGRRAKGGGLDLAAVSEEQMAEALDKIERELGYTLTGPVRELVNTADRQRPVEEPRRRRAGRDRQGGRRDDPARGTARSRRSTPSTSGPTRPTRPASTSRSWPASATAPSPLDCKDVGTAALVLPGNLPARSPIRVKFSHQPRRPPQRHRHRPDRRRARSTSSSRPRPSWGPRTSPNARRRSGS